MCCCFQKLQSCIILHWAALHSLLSHILSLYLPAVLVVLCAISLCLTGPVLQAVTSHACSFLPADPASDEHPQHSEPHTAGRHSVSLQPDQGARWGADPSTRPAGYGAYHADCHEQLPWTCTGTKCSGDVPMVSCVAITILAAKVCLNTPGFKRLYFFIVIIQFHCLCNRNNGGAVQ